MAVDAPRLPPEAEEPEHLAHGVVHHLLAVGQRVVLGPQHVCDVGAELRRALGERREVRVLEPLVEILGQPAGLGDVRLRELVADAPAARVQHHPHPRPLVDAEFLVGITEPTVAPIPTWASGMSATWPSTIGSRAVFSAWRRVSSSMSLAQERSLSSTMVGTFSPRA
jgi:hypothetical protein